MRVIFKNIFTCPGTAAANILGICLGLRKTLMRYKIDPDKAFAKNTFHMINHSTFIHALLSI